MTIRPAEHVQLGVEVDDHVSGVTPAIEELVDGGEGLHRALERSHGQRCAAGEHEGSNRSARMAKRAHERHEQEPEGRHHRDARAHDQERVEPRGLLGLLGRQAVAYHQPPLVEAEVERDSVERERTAEQRPEAEVRDTPCRRFASEDGRQRKEGACRQHREAGNQVDVRVTDRIDPLARVPGLVEPVRVRRLHLDHALHGPDGQARAPVARNFQRWRFGLGTRTRRDWKIVRNTFAAKHQYPRPITPAPMPTGTRYALPMWSFAAS